VKTADLVQTPLLRQWPWLPVEPQSLSIFAGFVSSAFMEICDRLHRHLGMLSANKSNESTNQKLTQPKWPSRFVINPQVHEPNKS